MNKLFASIVKNDVSALAALLGNKSALVNTVAPNSPTQYAKMIPLQVALCCSYGRYIASGYQKIDLRLANLLLDNGADVNAMPEGPYDGKNNDKPVIFEAVRIASMCCRFNDYDDLSGRKQYSTQECADTGFHQL